MNEKKLHFHFVGIGGAGQSGIASILHQLGFNVSGSDTQESAITERMKKLGIKVFIGHKSKNISHCDILVVSTAVPPTNPEIVCAKKKNIPIISRGEMLGILMKTKRGIAIAGTHGKTTTTSLISLILEKNNFSPTILVGGEVQDIGGNAKLGYGDYLVAEADESDGSFLYLNPFISVVTNIEEDHLEHLKNLKNIISLFKKFIHRTHPDGLVVLCNDHPNVKNIIPQIKRRYLTYGLNSNSDIYAKNILMKKGKVTFDAFYNSKFLGNVSLKIPGVHNVYNSLAAICVCLWLGIDFANIKNTISKLGGAERRFQLLGKFKGAQVIDDYAHHPTEIKATLSCARYHTKKRVIAIFQPHRYTRTKFLFNEFTTAFYDADIIIVSDIYPASEKPIKGVTSKKLAEGIQKVEKNKIIKYISTKEEIIDYVSKTCQKGDIILTLGAGNIWQVGKELVETHHR